MKSILKKYVICLQKRLNIKIRENLLLFKKLVFFLKILWSFWFGMKFILKKICNMFAKKIQKYALNFCTFCCLKFRGISNTYVVKK